MHMIQWITDRLQRKDDEGFTLIELMVVVLIIAILIAIAIPTFLGARGRAQDRAAQSSLRNSVTAAKAIYTDDEDYADATIAEMNDSEPAIQFTTTESINPPNHVAINGGTSPSSIFVAAAQSANGNRCWGVTDRVSPGATANPGTWWRLTNDASCTVAEQVAAVTFDPADPPTVDGAWVRQPGDAVCTAC
jgi:type IV pilus assembly protein PilA